MHVPDQRELEALTTLLDDSDPTVTTAVQRRFVTLGYRGVPVLRRIIAHGPQESIHVLNAQACLHAIQTEALATLVGNVIDARADGCEVDLEEAALLLSTFGYPETNPQWCQQHLDQLAAKVREYAEQLPGSGDLRMLLALNTVVFEHERFCGALKNYYSASHSYIAPVLELKQGIPISLSVVYMLVAGRIGIELWGIGMPLHFLVYHPSLDVFIDPFNAGVFVSRDECRQFVQQVGFTFSDSMLERRSNEEIVMRMMRNLIYAHSKSGQQWEAETLGEALSALVGTENQH